MCSIFCVSKKFVVCRSIPFANRHDKHDDTTRKVLYEYWDLFNWAKSLNPDKENLELVRIIMNDHVTYEKTTNFGESSHGSPFIKRRNVGITGM